LRLEVQRTRGATYSEETDVPVAEEDGSTDDIKIKDLETFN
jgi:hypothetical protein